MKIKNIVIVGGGTAGWSTAHHFLSKTSERVKITVVASKEIPIIGVGESTTGLFNDMIKNCHTLGDEKEFLKETESTFKLGIKHSDWHTKGQSFYSPIGDNYSNDFSYPHKDYDNVRIYHIAENLSYDNWLQSSLMKNNKLHIINNQSIFDIDTTQTGNPVAYHLDTYKVGQYLKRKALDVERCNYIDDQVIDFEQNSQGFLTCVITKSGKKIEGDMFIDCSGFARVLIDKVEENNWVSYSNNLLVDSALNFNYELEEDEEIKTYTHAWAQKYGWCWEIPTQTRMGCGYVFSSQHTDFSKAYDEISKVMKNKKINVQREIKFDTGRLEKFWIKNVLSTGLSSAFIEPLEATSIHATMIQTTHFIENYYKEDMPFECDLFSKKYNDEMIEMWDYIRDFIVFHYISPRKDTDFWKHSSSTDRLSPRLNELLEIWKYRMPRVIDYISDKNNNFYNIGNTLYYQIAIGMKLLNSDIAKQELKGYNLYDKTKNHINLLEENLKKVFPLFIKTNEYYKSL